MRPLCALFLFVVLILPVGASLADEVTIGFQRFVVSGPTIAQPRAAFGGGVYLVVWQDGWSGVGATADIKGMRLKAHTLEPLDKEPLLICAAPDAQEAPAVAFANGVFLVVWQDFRNGKNHGVVGKMVDARKGLINTNEIAIAVQAGNQVRPAVASDAKTFFVVWQETRGRDAYSIRGVRLSSGGQLLDQEPHEYAALGTSPALSVSGGKVLVAWTNLLSVLSEPRA